MDGFPDFEKQKRLTDEWEEDEILLEYFNYHTALAIDWERFNGIFFELINAYFSGVKFDIGYFYKSEENED